MNGDPPNRMNLNKKWRIFEFSYPEASVSIRLASYEAENLPDGTEVGSVSCSRSTCHSSCFIRGPCRITHPFGPQMS